MAFRTQEADFSISLVQNPKPKNQPCPLLFCFSQTKAVLLYRNPQARISCKAFGNIGKVVHRKRTASFSVRLVTGNLQSSFKAIVGYILEAAPSTPFARIATGISINNVVFFHHFPPFGQNQGRAAASPPPDCQIESARDKGQKSLCNVMMTPPAKVRKPLARWLGSWFSAKGQSARYQSRAG